MLRFYTHHDFAMGSEFYGISDEIGDNLPQSGRISYAVRPAPQAEVTGEFKSFFVSAHAHDFHGVAQAVAQIKFDNLDVQLAGLDLGKVQDVIEKQQQSDRRSS